MRKVIGMGETILDILFRNNQPIAAVPGGSCFNSIISLGRTATNTTFVGYTGNDHVGRQIADFLKENGVNTDYFEMRDNEKSAVSLAYLDQNGDADYVFYKTAPNAKATMNIPQMESDDVLLYGSFFASGAGSRGLVKQMLENGRKAGTITYYDLNFRKTHQHELEQLMPVLIDNFHLSSIVRGSADDFEIMYNQRDARTIYREHIAEHCPIFICTSGPGLITICTPSLTLDYEVPQIKTVSTVGAGDNFNAGFIYAMLRDGIKQADLTNLSAEAWIRLIETGCRFATEVCQSQHNSISKEFASTLTDK